MEPTDYLIKILKESEEERKNGDYYSFDNADDAIKFLDNIIDGKEDEKN
ncbi:MAG: hypothetical protein ABIC82_01145 [bacterium]